MTVDGNVKIGADVFLTPSIVSAKVSYKFSGDLLLGCLEDQHLRVDARASIACACIKTVNINEEH